MVVFVSILLFALCLIATICGVAIMIFLRDEFKYTPTLEIVSYVVFTLVSAYATYMSAVGLAQLR